MDEKITRVSGTLDETEENKKALYDAMLSEFKRLYWDLPETERGYNFHKNNETGEVIIFITNSKKYIVVDTENHVQL